MFPWSSSADVHMPNLAWLAPALKTWTHLIQDYSALAHIDPRQASQYQWRSRNALVQSLATACDRSDVNAMSQAGADSDFDLFAATPDEHHAAFLRGQYVPYEVRGGRGELPEAVQALTTAVSQLNVWQRQCAAPPSTNWLALLFLVPRLTDLADLKDLRSPTATLRGVDVATSEGPQTWELAIESWAPTGGEELATAWTDGHYWPGVHLLGFTMRGA